MDNETTQAVNILSQMKELVDSGWKFSLAKPWGEKYYLATVYSRDKSQGLFGSSMDEAIGTAVQWAKENSPWDTK